LSILLVPIYGTISKNDAMKKIPGCVFVATFSLVVYMGGTAFSQEQDYDKLGFSIGREQYALRDELMTPMTYSNTGTCLGLLYYGAATNERHIVIYRYARGTIQSTTNREMNFTRHYFEYGYCRRIASFAGNSGKLFLGLGTNNFITTREGPLHVKALGTTASEYSSGDFLFSLNLSLRSELALANTYLIQIQSSFPAVAYIVRPHYSVSQGSKFSDGSFKSIDKYFLNRTNVSIGIPIYGPLEAECGYSFSYYSIQQPMRVQSLIHTAGLGVMYKF
jgi:hypothetical protein